MSQVIEELMEQVAEMVDDSIGEMADEVSEASSSSELVDAGCYGISLEPIASSFRAGPSSGSEACCGVALAKAAQLYPRHGPGIRDAGLGLAGCESDFGVSRSPTSFVYLGWSARAQLPTPP